VLDAVALLAERGLVVDRDAVDLAAWFHDAVYDVGRDDNEDRSAELARHSDPTRYARYARAAREATWPTRSGS
jgi:predicted metal-dependent HD superfamily phosphohydrolase